MKKINKALLLSAFLISGCQVSGNGLSTDSSVNNTSTSSVNGSSNKVSTTSSSSSLSNSSSSTSISSSSSSESVEWIKNGGVNEAINNSGEWIYSSDSDTTMTLAEYNEDSLYVSYKNATKWDSVQLYYHDSKLSVNKGYTVSFDITSNKNGKITINNQEFEVKDGTKTITLESTLLENSCAISIQFGVKNGSILTANGNIIISNLKVNKKQTAADIVTKALESNNYTLSLVNGMNGYTGEFKFFENATFFSWANSIDGIVGNIGYGENSEGIFSFGKKSYEGNDYFESKSGYYKDEENQNVKGLYTSEHVFTYEGLNGMPSLHHLNLNQLDLEVEVGTPVKIKNGSSLKALTFMLDEFYATYYYSGVNTATVMLNSDGNLEFTFTNRVKESSTFVLSNIGNTTDSLLEEYISSENFMPGASGVKVDEELKSMLDLINGSNYLVNKADGSLFCINDKYIYDEVVDIETNEKVISGYIKLNDGIYHYTIENDEVIVDEEPSAYESISELGGLKYISYFNDPTLYSRTNDGLYEMNVSSNDYSWYTFGSKWLGQTIMGLDKVSLEKGISNITIGAHVNYYIGESETLTTEWKYLVVYQINNAQVDILENYLAK